MNALRLPNWLKQRAFLTPDRMAVKTETESVTFRDLEERAGRYAFALSLNGVGKGSRVALLQNNTLDLIVSYHALIYLEAVAIPLNTRLSVREWEWQLADSESDLLLVGEAYQDRLTHVTSLKIKKISELKREAQSLSPFTPEDEVALDSLHTIIYTSGTTGHPKGVRLTLGNHWWSAIGSALNLGLSEQDNWLCVVPLFHVSGLSILMKSVIYGMTVTLIERFSPDKVNSLINKGDITHVSVVSTMLQAMVEDDEIPLEPSSAFRCALLGGGPAPLPLLNKCYDRQIPVYQTYGLSETASQIVTLAPEYMFTKLGSAGKPLFPAQIQILKEGEVMGPNQEGEILVKGPNVTGGYDHLPEASQSAIKEGWLYTGDMGRLDEEGFLYVLDRRKDMIVSGGENVYPAEIESVLMEHPDVKEAGVIGVPDERWGRIPVAFVVLREGKNFHQDQLLHFCREHLAGYKVPKKILLHQKELPRNASKKLLRRELRALWPEISEED